MKYRQWLLIQTGNMCRNESDAEDLVQEATMRFIVAFQDRPAPDERACGTWLANTIHHLFIDQCRRRRVRSQAELDPNLQDTLSAEPGPPSAYESLSEERFSEAMAKLTPKEREALLLQVKGHKYKDIAHRLGLKMGTVSKRLYDARARLQKLLNPTEQGEV